MKTKILYAILSVAFAFSLQAQQTINIPAPRKSPEIKGDTVTFRIKAPKASEVRIGGALSGVKPLLTTHADGEWVFTYTGLAPDLYDYWFDIDGIKVLDPSNPYVARDISSLFNIFIKPGDESAWYEALDVPHGTVEKVWYHSPSLGGDRRMTVYLPAGYEEGDREYPVFYLLHGMGGDEDAWQELGRAIQILDNGIASGEVEPMIVVMPNGNARRMAAPGFTADGMYIPEGEHSADPQRQYEKSFPEIMEYIDSHYRVKKGKENRAIAGLSMGGGHSWRISMLNPDDFDFVGLFSAAVRWNGNGVDQNNDAALPEMIDRQFANPPALYYIAIGKDDFLYDLNADYRQLLDRKGINYEYMESEGGHTWTNWRKYLTNFLPRLFKQ